VTPLNDYDGAERYYALFDEANAFNAG